MAPGREHAEEYAEGGVLYDVQFRSENPLHIRDPRAFQDLWEQSGASQTEGRFHAGPNEPSQSRTFTEWLRGRGYDAMVLHPEAFEESPDADWTEQDQRAWETLAGTYGDPQTVILDPSRATFTPITRDDLRDRVHEGAPARVAKSTKPPKQIKSWDKSLTRQRATAEAKRVVQDLLAHYGGAGDAAPELEIREDEPGFGARIKDGRVVLTEGLMARAMDKTDGVHPFRVVAHEAAHLLSGTDNSRGYTHRVEEGAAEILSIAYWAQRGQPFDRRDAVRRGNRWTKPGAESLIESVVYEDQVQEVMARAVSKVGPDRQAVLSEVERAMRGDYNDRLDWRDQTSDAAAKDRSAADWMRWVLGEGELSEPDRDAQRLAALPYDPHTSRVEEPIEPGLPGSRRESLARYAEHGQEIRDSYAIQWRGLSEQEKAQRVAVAARYADEGETKVEIPLHALDAVLQDRRIKSIFELPEAKGEFYLDSRSMFEELMWNAPPDMDPTTRPVYGFVGMPEDEAGYGAAQFVLKPGTRKRTTVTLGDSLNIHARNSIPVEQVSRTDKDTLLRSGELPLWDEEPLGYMEAQIHGGVDLDDVDFVRVFESPMSADLDEHEDYVEMVRKLRDAGLRVIEHPAPWRGR